MYDEEEGYIQYPSCPWTSRYMLRCHKLITYITADNTDNAGIRGVNCTENLGKILSCLTVIANKNNGRLEFCP